jgi:Mg2+ and Co2+ transporter CorA
MKAIAEKNSRDSSSMRVLTIITMIYLPCTIVSNFYSTQFVHQTELDGGVTKLGYAQNVWLFFAISIPLTMFTFLVWYAWVHAGCKQRVLAGRQAELP